MKLHDNTWAKLATIGVAILNTCDKFTIIVLAILVCIMLCFPYQHRTVHLVVENPTDIEISSAGCMAVRLINQNIQVTLNGNRLDREFAQELCEF